MHKVIIDKNLDTSSTYVHEHSWLYQELKQNRYINPTDSVYDFKLHAEHSNWNGSAKIVCEEIAPLVIQMLNKVNVHGNDAIEHLQAYSELVIIPIDIIFDGTESHIMSITDMEHPEFWDNAYMNYPPIPLIDIAAWIEHIKLELSAYEDLLHRYLGSYTKPKEIIAVSNAIIPQEYIPMLSNFEFGDKEERLISQSSIKTFAKFFDDSSSKKNIKIKLGCTIEAAAYIFNSLCENNIINGNLQSIAELEVFYKGDNLIKYGNWKSSLSQFKKKSNNPKSIQCHLKWSIDEEINNLVN